jgi:hypothetical protein
MATGSTIVELYGCVLSLCMSELVRRDGADSSSLAKMMRALEKNMSVHEPLSVSEFLPVRECLPECLRVSQ